MPEEGFVRAKRRTEKGTYFPPGHGKSFRPLAEGGFYVMRPACVASLPSPLPPTDARQENPQKALELFQKVVTLEAEKGPEIRWRFKALEHLVRIHFQLQNFDQMLSVRPWAGSSVLCFLCVWC